MLLVQLVINHRVYESFKLSLASLFIRQHDPEVRELVLFPIRQILEFIQSYHILFEYLF